MTSKQILSSKFAVGLLIVILAFLVNSEYKQWRQTQAVKALKNDLLKQANLQNQKNQELADSINFINSDDFKEQVARQQLNLKKNGEVVYSFTPDQDEATGTEQNTVAVAAVSNPEKWWHYFFQ
jgi:cell division protein FtsB